MIYLSVKGSIIEERALMNVGYAMVAVIMVNLGTNFLAFVITSIVAFSTVCRKIRRRKRDAYRFEVQSEDGEHSKDTITNKN